MRIVEDTETEKEFVIYARVWGFLIVNVAAVQAT